MRKIFACIICSFLISISAIASYTTYGPTTADDTLWHIASELRPNNDVSVQQVMLAIFCCNEDAFSSANMNALESGKIIKLPSINRINVISKKQAYLEVEKQNRQWKRPAKKKRKILKQPTQQLAIEIPQPVPVTLPVEPPALSQQEAAFISDTNSHLMDIEAKIEAKNDSMQTQIVQFNEKLNSIEQNIEQLRKNVINFELIQQYAKFAILFVGVIILLFIILFLLILRRRKNSIVAKEEYNLMESKEGVAAKLNVARVYIDMGKEAEAYAMLNEVLVNGSQSEQAEAKELLAKIKK